MAPVTEVGPWPAALGGFSGSDVMRSKRSLFAGTSTGAAKEVTEMVAAVTRAVGQAVEVLPVVSARCATYADQV